MIRSGHTIMLVVVLVAASCSSDSSALEAELTSDIEIGVEALNTFAVNRTEQRERFGMQNLDTSTWAEFLAAAEEANDVVDFSIVDREAERLSTVVQRARAGGLETVNGALVDDLEMFAASLRDWSIVEAPLGELLYDCLVAAGTGLELDTPMSVVMQNLDAVDCLQATTAELQEALDAQDETNRFSRRINRDWEG